MAATLDSWRRFYDDLMLKNMGSTHTEFAMAASSLSQAVDLWTAQVMVARRYLTRLYRVLDDDRQAAMAQQACGPCEERAQRLGLHGRIQALQTEFADMHPDDTLGELKAWETMVQAQAGLLAFHSLVDEDHERSRNLRGSKTQTTKAFQKALRGYRTAFPEEITFPGFQQAIETAAFHCAEAFSQEVGDLTDEEKRNLQREVQAKLLDALKVEAGGCL